MPMPMSTEMPAFQKDLHPGKYMLNQCQKAKGVFCAQQLGRTLSLFKKVAI